MKYIIIINPKGFESAILMPLDVNHSSAVNVKEGKPVSAGFFMVILGRVHVLSVPSTSLNLHPRPVDEQLITSALKQGGVL